MQRCISGDMPSHASATLAGALTLGLPAGIRLGSAATIFASRSHGGPLGATQRSMISATLTRSPRYCWLSLAAGVRHPLGERELDDAVLEHVAGARRERRGLRQLGDRGGAAAEVGERAPREELVERVGAERVRGPRERPLRGGAGRALLAAREL